jgi:tetratricopeptide (TPR) repeat protein
MSKYYFVVIILTFGLLSILLINCSQEVNTIQWMENLKLAKETATQKKKPLVVYYRTTDNEFCKDMEKKTFYSNQIIQLRDKFIWLWIDADIDIENPGRYGVIAYPTLITYSYEGKELIRYVGYLEAEELREILEDTIEGRCIYDEIVEKVESNPEDVELMWELAQAQKDRGMTFELLETLDKIIEGDPDNELGYKSRALLERGFQFMIVGNYKEAIVRYENLIEEYPDTTEAPIALDYIGDCYRLLDKREEAMEIYQRVLDEYPESKSAVQAKNKLGQMEAFEKTVKALWE